VGFAAFQERKDYFFLQFSEAAHTRPHLMNGMTHWQLPRLWLIIVVRQAFPSQVSEM
jgi:hypothetical protein